MPSTIRSVYQYLLSIVSAIQLTEIVLILHHIHQKYIAQLRQCNDVVFMDDAWSKIVV